MPTAADDDYGLRFTLALLRLAFERRSAEPVPHLHIVRPPARPVLCSPLSVRPSNRTG